MTEMKVHGSHTFAFNSLIVLLLATGCSSSTTPPQAFGPVRDVDRDRDFVLTLETTKATWQAEEPIEVLTTLEYVGPGDGTPYFGSGGGPLTFDLREMSGTRILEGLATADCATHEIDVDRPLRTGYQKSGGFSPGEPNEAFYRAFLNDPLFRLPAGDWELSVRAYLYLPPGCGGGREVDLRATIGLRVR